MNDDDVDVRRGCCCCLCDVSRQSENKTQLAASVSWSLTAKLYPVMRKKCVQNIVKEEISCNSDYLDALLHPVVVFIARYNIVQSANKRF